MAADEEPSRGRIALTILLWIVGFPALWPLHAIRTWGRRRLHLARAARVVPADRDAILERIAKDEARSALESTLSWSTIASGHDEQVIVELSFDDGAAVLAQSPELNARLREKSVPVRRIECHQLGIANLFAWPLWLASVLLIASHATGEVGLAVMAGVVVLGLVGLAFT